VKGRQADPRPEAAHAHPLTLKLLLAELLLR
jgi:hypothetical protein